MLIRYAADADADAAAATLDACRRAALPPLRRYVSSLRRRYHAADIDYFSCCAAAIAARAMLMLPRFLLRYFFQRFAAMLRCHDYYFAAVFAMPPRVFRRFDGSR